MNLLGGEPSRLRVPETGGRHRCGLPPQPIARLRSLDGYLGTNRYGSEADFHITVDDGVAVLCGNIYVQAGGTLSLIDAFALRETSR